MKKILTFLLIVSAACSLRAQNTVEYLLVMRNVGTDTMWDGAVVPIYGFAPNILSPWLPGPVLTCNEGDSLKVRAWNISQGAHHTIHWHGLDVDMRNDGVHDFSFGIHHMEDCTYVFKVHHSGTYLYHCHVASVVHVQMGMYGAVVVKAANGANTAWTGGPAYHQDKLWLTSEIDKSWHDSVPVHSIGDSLIDPFPIPPYNPDYFLVNGLSKTQLWADSSVHVYGMAGEKILLRLANVGNFGNTYIFPHNLNATVIMSDGRPLPQSVRTDTLRVLSGERYEVMIQPSAEFDYSVSLQYFDPDNRRVWDTEYLPVSIRGVIGIADSQDPDALFSVWPNPALTELNFSWEKVKDDRFRIRMVDAKGSVVMDEEIVNSGSFIRHDISTLSPGIYLVNIKGAKTDFSAKILIRP